MTDAAADIVRCGIVSKKRGTNMKRMILCVLALILIVSMLAACEPNSTEDASTTATTTTNNPGPLTPGESGGLSGGGLGPEGLELPQLPID